jgi:hypothetical protein
VVLEVREGRARGGLKLQRIWTTEVGNRKITNKPPTYRLHRGHWSAVLGVKEEFPSVETWGTKIFEIGTRFCHSTDILNLPIVQEIIEKWFTNLFRNPRDWVTLCHRLVTSQRNFVTLPFPPNSSSKTRMKYFLVKAGDFAARVSIKVPLARNSLESITSNEGSRIKY